MRYVALLSGGKDSCFNLLHCARNGHELIAAASLGPGPGKDEIDSYLYQTVGQDAIQLVADALGIPLLRRVITGEAVQRGSEYGSRMKHDPQGVQGDETEDMLGLLSEVKTKFPNVEGVSVGAILSNYQRVRVENVCQRLSLTPLCYLWQRDQSELLSEMIDSGLKAILIKVAGIGLTTKHLGRTLAEMQPTLMKLNSMYGAHVCGEGGEYESLTLDSPLFKHQIVLEDVETVIHSDNDFATVAFLKVNHASLKQKPPSEFALPTIPAPRLLYDADEYIGQAVLSAIAELPSVPTTATPSLYQHWSCATTAPYFRKLGPWVVASNIEAAYSTASPSVEEEMRSCFKVMQAHLAVHSLTLSHISNITLLISSIELFPVVNAIYASFFGTSPPARACVAVDLPPPTRIRLECFAYAESDRHERNSLHVQSLSYWAPANIGPYSQAITVGERVFVSGQIGLIPSSNTLPSPRSLPQEVALSLRHVRSIADAVKPSLSLCWDGVTQGIITWLTHAKDLIAVQRGMMVSDAFRPGSAPTLFIVVKSLPKDALIETQVLLHTARRASLHEDDAESTKVVPKFIAGQWPGLQVRWEASYLENINASLAVVACMSDDDEGLIAEKLASETELQKLWQKTIAIRLFHTPLSKPDLPRLFRRLFGSDNKVAPVMAIPSRVVATFARDSWDYALCFIG